MLFSYRTATQASTGRSPFHLVYGREPRIPLDVHVDTPLPDPRTVVQYTETVKQEHRRLKEEVETKLADARARQAQAYDKGAREGYYVAGDLVYLYSPAVKGLSQKLHCSYTGPFRVIQKVGEVNYDIIRPRRGKPKRYTSTG